MHVPCCIRHPTTGGTLPSSCDLFCACRAVQGGYALEALGESVANTFLGEAPCWLA